MTGERAGDEFAAINRIASLWNVPVHGALANLLERPVRHSLVIGQADMQRTVKEILAGFSG